jgi:hypothetical protein
MKPGFPLRWAFALVFFYAFIVGIALFGIQVFVANIVNVFKRLRDELEGSAFLTEEQPDPLVTGYEMGLCTRRILDAWGLGARTSRSLASPTPFAGTGAV